MKVCLLYRDRDFDMSSPLPWNAEALTCDLELRTLFETMAQGDEFIHQVAEKVVLVGFEKDTATIRYRQEVLHDCLERPAAVRALYALAVETAEMAKKQYLGLLRNHADSVLRHSIEHMEEFLGRIKRLRRFAESHAGKFASEGWNTLLVELQQQLTNEYLAGFKDHLWQLQFRNGVLLSAELGDGNKGDRYVLHRPPPSVGQRWLVRFFPRLAALFARRPPSAFSFSVDPRDEAGVRALREIKSRGIAPAARALAQSRDQVHDFFGALRTELAFFVGCLNLRDRLVALEEPVCFPIPAGGEESRLSFQGLYDASLALKMERRVIGNDADADGISLVMITGANQGGKSTFLRSFGLAQLMMQCGMFVTAESFRGGLCNGLFTHFKREEDVTLESGKLDEELGRMSDIVDHLASGAMVLMNESFAATNEREGSEIARQVISALLEGRIRVGCVTHLYELARGFYDQRREDTLFLRAKRREHGARTFKLSEGEPLPTSFGEDLYREIFGEAPEQVSER